MFIDELISEFEDAKAIIAGLELILMSSVRYGVNATDLSSELQQLGLPREHSVAIGRLHTDNFSCILDSLTAQSLRCNYILHVYSTSAKGT